MKIWLERAGNYKSGIEISRKGVVQFCLNPWMFVCRKSSKFRTEMRKCGLRWATWFFSLDSPDWFCILPPHSSTHLLIHHEDTRWNVCLHQCCLWSSGVLMTHACWAHMTLLGRSQMPGAQTQVSNGDSDFSLHQQCRIFSKKNNFNAIMSNCLHTYTHTHTFFYHTARPPCTLTHTPPETLILRKYWQDVFSKNNNKRNKNMKLYFEKGLY